MKAGRYLVMRVTVVMAIAMLQLACGDEAPLPGPGTFTATVVGPSGAEGAAVLVMYAEGVQSLTAVPPTELFTEASGGVDRIVLIHPDGGSLAFEVAVADTLAPRPTFGIEQVAGTDDALRTDLTAYSVELSR